MGYLIQGRCPLAITFHLQRDASVAIAYGLSLAGYDGATPLRLCRLMCGKAGPFRRRF
jgi:hypothetical protein